MDAPVRARPTSFYATTLGKKVVMAVTGFIWFGYLVLHVLGNLMVFAGRERINAYAAFLHVSPVLLWLARLILIAALMLHVTATVQLYSLKAATRPIGYEKKKNRGARIYSLIMLWSGLALLAFIVYHILHLTTGTLHPDFVERDVYHNMATAYGLWWVVVIYFLAMVILAMHLNHALWSMTQSVGVSRPDWSARLKWLAIVIALILAGAFAAIPAAGLAGGFR